VERVNFVRVIFLCGFFVRPLLAVNVQTFYSSPSLSFELMEEAETGIQADERSNLFSASLGGTWVKNPFVLKNSSNSAITGEPLPSLKTIQFASSLLVYPWLSFGLKSGFGFFDWKTLDATSGVQTNSGTASGLLDVEVSAKMRIVDREKYVLSLMPVVIIPTHSGKFDPISGDSLGKNAFLSDEGIGLGLKVLGDYELSFLKIAANLGFKHNNEAKYGDLDYRSVLLSGIGFSCSVVEKISLNVEYLRQWTLPLSNNINPNELLLGMHAKLPLNLVAYGAVTLGNFFEKEDGSSYGFTAGLKYVPFFDKNEKN
jgi:hypothetical protein